MEAENPASGTTVVYATIGSASDMYKEVIYTSAQPLNQLEPTQDESPGTMCNDMPFYSEYMNSLETECLGNCAATVPPRSRFMRFHGFTVVVDTLHCGQTVSVLLIHLLNMLIWKQ